MLGSAAGDGEGHAERVGNGEVENAATDDAASRVDRAVLAAVPAVAGADGGTVRRVELPLLGAVAAGLPIEAIATDETLAVPPDMVRKKKDNYVLRVEGNSMIEEQIRDGDYIVVQAQQTAEDGQMVVALVGGESATVKKLYRESGGRIRLQPANPTMKPIFADARDVRVQGVVVGVIRKY